MVAVEKIRDINSLKEFSPLDGLDSERLNELLEEAYLHELKKGQSVSAVTEKNQTAYLLSGEVVRAPGSADVERIKAGSARAHQPLLNAKQRVRVLAESDVRVLCVDSDLLEFLCSWGSSNGLVVDEIDTSESAEWVDSLMQSDAVLSLPPTSLQALMSAIKPVERSAGEEIFKQGADPDYYYIISRGHCRVSCRRNGDAQSQEIAILETGEAFGEEALIANAPRGATVTMVDDGLLLRLDRDTFKKLLEQPMVHTISMAEAERTRATGAVMLDLRPASEFARDGRGLNIPFIELRNEINTLSRDKHYIVVSDDNRTSAVAAFLLGQKQFKVAVLQTAAREEMVAKAAEATAQARELQAFVGKLEQELAESRQRLTTEQAQHANNRARLQILETEMRDTQKRARSAIVEASVLKNKSEAMLRSRISELSSELEQEKEQRLAQPAEAERLRTELTAVQQQLQSLQSMGEEDEAQLRLQQLQQEQKQLQAAYKELEQQLQQRQEHAEAQGQELAALQQQLAEATIRADQAGQALDDLTSQQEQLQTTLAEKEVAQQLLTQQLSEASGKTEQLQETLRSLQQEQDELLTTLRTSEMERVALQQELERLQQSSTQQRQQLQEELNTLHNEHIALEQSQERSLQVIHQTREQIKQLERERAGLEQRLEAQERSAQTERMEAQQDREMLDEKIKRLKALMVEKQTQYKLNEASYQQQQSQLQSALKNAQAENQKLQEESNKEKLRNNILSEEMVRLKYENRRTGFMFKFLVFVIAMIAVALGVAHYMGVDLQGEAITLIGQARPVIDRLMEAIPKP